MSDKRDEIEQMIREALKGGDPTGWFEQLYALAASGQAGVPWAMGHPHPHLLEWAEQQALRGEGRRALVVGCGLGDDAEELARRGFAVTAFDIAPTAIEGCRARFPSSQVDYQVADLLALPEAWAGGFDFVLECRTIQSLPWQLTEAAAAAIMRVVAPGGLLLVLCLGREPHEPRHGIPWPLSRDELALFLHQGLEEQSFEEPEAGPRRHFRVLYRRPRA